MCHRSYNHPFKHILYKFIFYLPLITLCYILQSNSFTSCPVMPLIYTIFNVRYLPALQVSEEEGLLQTASGAPLLQRNGKKWLCHWWLQVSMACGEHRGDWLTVSRSQHPPHLFRHLQGQDTCQHFQLAACNFNVQHCWMIMQFTSDLESPSPAPPPSRQAQCGCSWSTSQRWSLSGTVSCSCQAPRRWHTG